MKSTTRERLAQCSTTMRHRQHTVEELDALVLDATAKWRAHCRQCAARGCDPFDAPGIEAFPFWTDEMREHRDRMRAEGRLSTPARGKLTEREKIEMNARFGPFRSGGIVPPSIQAGSAYAELAEKYKDATYSPAQPRPKYRTTRTTMTPWRVRLSYFLLWLLAFAFGYIIDYYYG